MSNTICLVTKVFYFELHLSQIKSLLLITRLKKTPVKKIDGLQISCEPTVQ